MFTWWKRQPVIDSSGIGTVLGQLNLETAMATSTKRSKFNVQSPRNRLGNPHVLKAFLQATLAFQRAAKTDEVDRAAEKPLSERLWEENLDLVDAAWKTQFMQGIAGGNLDPNDYGQYTVQDAAYCNAATENLKFLTDKVEDSDLKKFFEDQYDGFKGYTEELYTTWFLKADGADLGPAAQWYVELERDIAQEEQPLYYLVSMIPCLRLWAYLAIKMKKEGCGCDKDSNIYKFWIDDNGSYKSAEKVEQVVNACSVNGLINEEKANEIYRKCMYGSACDEPLLIIPP